MATCRYNVRIYVFINNREEKRGDRERRVERDREKPQDHPITSDYTTLTTTLGTLLHRELTSVIF